MSAPGIPIACRWKHLGGEGRLATYRATCGHKDCPGHLGDLAYSYDEARQLDGYFEQYGQADGLFRSGLLPYDLTQHEAIENEVRRIVSQNRTTDLPEEGTWTMSAQLTTSARRSSNRGRSVSDFHIYHGDADHGYRIEKVAWKQMKNGIPIPRRPIEGFSRDLRVPGLTARVIQGQTVCPMDRVWCSSCGRLNLLDWPAALKPPD